jgi:hypothetical protein
MFRNPPAHAPKIAWVVNREDAEDVFTLLSMIHKRIDAARTPARAREVQPIGLSELGRQQTLSSGNWPFCARIYSGST